MAIVQDALPFRGGAENVLEEILAIVPDAPLYTAVYNPRNFVDSRLARQTIYTSFIDRLAGAGANHYRYAPLFPAAMERFDLRGYEMVLSCSYAFAHRVRPPPGQLHVCYMYTPFRYAWRRSALEGAFSRPTAWLAGAWLHSVRRWDVAAAARVDHFITVSRWVAACIRHAYRRRAEVIYPPVAVDDFRADARREAYYVVVSRLARHKRVALLVDAFSRLGYPLYVLGDGPEHQRLAARAAGNVRFLGHQPRATVAELLGRARALVHAAEEDFGIALVEAQAAGCPVIAYGRGGSRETVIEGQTGFFFRQPSVESVMTAVRGFEEGHRRLDAGVLRRNAERFRPERFQRELRRAIERQWYAFRRRVVPDTGRGRQ